MVKSTPSSSAIAGDDVSFVLTVRNDGPSDATGIMISDTLPANIVPTTATPTGSVACAVDDQTISCGGPSLAVGASFDVTINATVAPSTPDNATPINTASVDAIEADADAANNGDTASLDITRQSDLRVTKSSGAQPVATAGSTHLFEIEVANIGLSDVAGVVVTDTLPAGTSFYATLSSGICSETSPGVVDCAVAAPRRSQADLVVAIEIAGSTIDGATITNSASATGLSADVDLTNNTDTANGQHRSQRRSRSGKAGSRCAG